MLYIFLRGHSHRAMLACYHRKISSGQNIHSSICADGIDTGSGNMVKPCTESSNDWYLGHSG